MEQLSNALSQNKQLQKFRFYCKKFSQGTNLLTLIKKPLNVENFAFPDVMVNRICNIFTYKQYQYTLGCTVIYPESGNSK